MTDLSTLVPVGPILAAGADPLSHVIKHGIFDVGGYTITNHVIMLVVSALLLVVFVPLVARSRGVVPSGAYNFFESILQFIREEVARPVLGELTDRFIPFLWTLFFLILTANLLGMVPLGMMAAPIDAHLAHIGGTATGNLSITAGLAICAFFIIHIGGMHHQGVAAYWKNFVPHVPVLLWPLMLVLELAGAIVKPFALCVRLFANMIAGHIVIAVILGFAVVGLKLGGAYVGVTAAAVLGAIAIGLLEVFVAFLQAYIFTFLTTLFVGMAVHPEH